jgi:hypothetical protein
VSMQVEVARLGRALAIYALPAEYGIVEYLRRRLARIAYGENHHGAAARAIKALQRIGVMQFPRDVTEIQQLLYRRHLAVPLGEPFIAANDGVDVDLDVVVERIAALARSTTRERPIEAVGPDDGQGKM